MDDATTATINASRDRMGALVGSLSDEDLGRPVEEGWTVAALLAHIAFWDRRTSGLLRSWARDGISPSPVDLDSVNEAALPQWRLLPPRAAADDALAAAEEIDGLVLALSAEEIATMRDAAVTIRIDRSGHRAAHLDQIERALGR